jgi:hypothetical protein
MRRHNFLMLSLLFVSLLLWVMPFPSMAQDVNLSFNDVLDALKPRSGRGLIYDILLYLIFILAFINQFLIPDKQLPMTLLNFSTMGAAIVIKLLVSIPGTPCTWVDATFQPDDYPTFFINIWLVVAPLLLAGGLRSVKGKPSNAVAPAVLTFLLSAVYFFIFWFTEQRPCSDPPAPSASLPAVEYVMSALTVGTVAVQQRFNLDC